MCISRLKNILCIKQNSSQKSTMIVAVIKKMNSVMRVSVIVKSMLGRGLFICNTVAQFLGCFDVYNIRVHIVVHT